jgi:CitMHS family citrate-Mg2+:H+ or citrate-Ca2+:H+ symporter
MPYVGFFWPLLLPCLIAALFTSFLLGWKGTTADIDKALAELPEAPAGMTWWKVLAPFAVFLGLVFMGRQWPYSTPLVGLPLMFAAAAVVSWALSPVPLRVVRVARDTIEQLLPLLATLTCAGILVQVMTLTGARGLMAVTAVTLPVAVVYATLFLVLPLSEAVLMGSAPVIGVPLVRSSTPSAEPDRGACRHEPHLALGDALPPTAIGRLTVNIGPPGSGSFLKACAVPAVSSRSSAR